MIEDEIARHVSGQMPSMAVFSETQQVSSAEKQAELAWRHAQLAVAQRGSHARVNRLPMLVGLMALAAVAAFFALRSGNDGGPTATTPSNELPWRNVELETGATVELPGVAVVSTTTHELGAGTRIATAIPGATIAVSSYRADYGMRGAGAAAIDLLQTRAADLGDTSAGRIEKTRDRWGDAYDLNVITDEPIARLRAIVVGSTLYVIEVVGSQTTRATQIFSRVVNTFTPKT